MFLIDGVSIFPCSLVNISIFYSTSIFYINLALRISSYWIFRLLSGFFIPMMYGRFLRMGVYCRWMLLGASSLAF
jgi:hypothetical protein